MKKLFTILFTLHFLSGLAAGVSLTPTISPAIFRYNDVVTVTYDVTGTSLASLSSAYIWVWIPGVNTDAKYNINPANGNASTNNAKFTKTVQSGKTLFSITFTPSDFFSGDISTATQLGILLKGNDWSNGQTTDYITTLSDGSFEVKITAPTQRPLFVQTSDAITITAETTVAATFDLYINNNLIDEQTGITNYSYQHTVAETSGSAVVKIVASANSKSSEASFQYIISATSAVQTRPSGIVPGINYNSSDATKATLCLWAPGKSSVYVLGDFTDWDINTSYLMKRDGEYFWLEITGLTSGVEYGFKYLVNETVFMADPYADKILDTDDQYISSSIYPSLKPYPTKAISDKSYFNRVAVLQTNQQPYVWQMPNFEKPAKEKLVVYELLVRDFVDASTRSYQTLMDTVSYFKRLGVNAIELMPIMEFNGNDSWGYNPTFMLAPDKAYGTKNALKAFIDKCHQNGIAVILDIAMNHQDIPNPYVLMDFDFDETVFKPTPENKWFNVTATHPYSVFYDMNHESTYTQAYLDTITHYWLNQYKIDGYRFDLSKGFTQKNTGSDVNAWSAYDASRIAILKRMTDKIWSHTPDAYIILEHFAANTEEKELAEYRADEGKGMMLWENYNYAYNQNTMGFATNSDISTVYYANKNWTVPHAVSYMESHDEERLMYNNLTSGRTFGSYNVKDLATALNRMKAATVLFYTIPGPKMLWEFGELGYDKSINLCTDGTISTNCRVTAKPVKWDYLQDVNRLSLFNHTANIIHLRNTYSVFTNGTATFSGGSALVKQITIKNIPYTDTPSTADEMNVQIVSNLDVSSQTPSVTFPHTGKWYDYGHGKSIDVTATSQGITLAPGEYKLFTDVAIEDQLPIVTAVGPELKSAIRCYPNPSTDFITIESDLGLIQHAALRTTQGAQTPIEKVNSNTWYVGSLPSGLYIVDVITQGQTHHIKLIKK
ncbi:MAG TPA: alpha-amylase family glycosyl hydrolase [Cyclobacteriaceae bacterium]|nr:alpha-amylase family glycosyl hydrolase [Cyclobacteriaceae bacterium]